MVFKEASFTASCVTLCRMMLTHKFFFFENNPLHYSESLHSVQILRANDAQGVSEERLNCNGSRNEINDRRIAGDWKNIIYINNNFVQIKRLPCVTDQKQSIK